MRRILYPLCLMFLLLLSGCSSLLPRGSVDTPAGFDSFAHAKDALFKIKAQETRLDELKALGFDPEEGGNVTLIPYPNIIGRLAPHPGVSLEQLDPGIRRCIEAQSHCRAYLFHFERQDRNRTGNFLLDFINIKRTTHVTGWSFDALIVVNDESVLFYNYAGQANIDKVEQQNNPLGPFQSSGEGLAGKLLH